MWLLHGENLIFFLSINFVRMSHKTVWRSLELSARRRPCFTQRYLFIQDRNRRCFQSASYGFSEYRILINFLRIRIQPFFWMRIHADSDPQSCRLHLKIGYTGYPAAYWNFRLFWKNKFKVLFFTTNKQTKIGFLQKLDFVSQKTKHK